VIRTFQGLKPTIPDSCFIEDTAVVIGDVVMGEECSVWFNAVIRGDVHHIRIGTRTNVQDLCMLHVTHDTHPLIIGNEVTIGHSVVLHGCTIEIVLVGWARSSWTVPIGGLGRRAGALVEGTVPLKSVILGSPGRVRRGVSDAELAWIKESAANYVKYSSQYLKDSSKRTGFKI
jgi:carbonic anhydrase/acetyltransferase-like protein (isoleucine patch superfamily)